MTRKYTMLSKDALFDPETGQILPIDAKVRPCHIDLPFYLWPVRQGIGAGKIDGDCYVGDGFKAVKVSEVLLNRLTIRPSGKFGWTDIRWRNPNGPEERLQVYVKKSHSGYLFGKTARVVEVTHTLLSGDDKTLQTCCRKFSTRLTAKRLYHAVHGLAVWDAHTQGGDDFSYGILGSKYRLYYRNQELNAACYAAVFGTWAILLNDNLSYQSIVILREAANFMLNIDTIFHTVNGYLYKLCAFAPSRYKEG